MAKHRLFVVGIFSIACLFANFVYLYRETPELNRSINPFDGTIHGVGNVAYSAAGWPWAFYEHLHRDNLFPLYRWNLSALTSNLIVWSLIFVIVWWWAKSHQQVTKELSGGRRLHLSLADLFVLMVSFGCFFGYLTRNRVQYAESQKLIKAIRNHRGSVTEGYFWPSFFQDNFIIDAFLPRKRIVGVSITEPPDALLKEIVALSTLHSLSIDGAGYSLDELRPLSRNFHLQYLRLSYRDIDQATVEMLSKSQSLQALSFLGTNMTDSMLNHLGEMPSLRQLNLGRTNVQLNEAICKPWMRAIRYLRLARAPDGKAPEFQLDGWPELVDVRLFGNEELQQKRFVGLAISNCPKLQKVSVLDYQRFDLKLEYLPNLKAIEIRSAEDYGGEVPLLPIRNVTFKDLPLLEDIHFEIWGFDQIHVENCPILQCNAYWTPGAETNLPAPKRRAQGLGEVFLSQTSENTIGASRKDAEQLFRSLSKSTGITSLNLAWFPTGDFDLSPIAACKTIKKLALPVTGFSKEQIQQLSNLDLEEVQFVQGAELQHILDVWPNLRRIEGAPKQAKLNLQLPSPYPNNRAVPANVDMHLKSASKLASVLFGDWKQASSVQLVDLPQLNDWGQISSNVTSMRIHGVPKLQALLTYAPWPEDASLDSLNELNAFAAGGPLFGDNEFVKIEQSKGLKALTLAHCAMTPERLVSIGKFTNLTALGVSGSSVTDETVRNWSNLNRLQTLMLDRTQVTSESLPWICSLRSLKNLSIDAHCFEAISPAQLDSLSGLVTLSLHGDGLELEKLAAVGSWKNLQVLRIENAKLTKTMLDQLFASLPMSLRVLDLCFCQMEIDDFAEFVLTLPQTVLIGVEGLKADEETQSNLLREFRAVIEDEGYMFQPGEKAYSNRSSRWPVRGPSDLGNSIVSYPDSFKQHANNASTTFQNPEVLVKPSVFAPKKAQ